MVNIFYLDECPYKSARYHCDKHVVKMLIEYAQMMSTAHRMLDGSERTVVRGAPWRRQRRLKRYEFDDRDKNTTFYAATHFNHPSCAWVRESSANYYWLYKMWDALHAEYVVRYDRIHKTYDRLATTLMFLPNNIKQSDDISKPHLAMPDRYKVDDPVQSYRNYYIGDKAKFAVWKYTETPDWFVADE